MVWAAVIIIILLLALGFSMYANARLAKRLFQFDELFQSIIDPMQEYRDELARIKSAEGLLHDHPEVMAFHRANMIMFHKIDAAINSIKEGRPQQEKPKGLPPKVV